MSVILVVDDSPQDSGLTTNALRIHAPEATVLKARDGAEAITLLEQRPPSSASPLVLLDLKMPKVDGFDLLRKLKGDDTTRSIRVVVLTSSSMPGDVRLAYSLGANSYIVKPVQHEQFVRTLGSLCRYWLELDQSPPLLGS